MFEFDPHIHSISSGHASQSTITDLAKKASSIGLRMIGITDHGPATLCSGKASYFRNLAYAPKKRCGVEILYGIELNILNSEGTVDLDDEILESLDYAIISMHQPNYKSGSVEENTLAYVNAMKYPRVKIVGHPEDVKFPVDFEALIVAAKHYGVAIEINNSSLSPEGYRGDVRENVRKMLQLCKKHECPVVLSSDSHGTNHVGDFSYALEIVRECDFPESLILNCSLDRFQKFIGKK
jgi:putative hydrolase